MVRLTCLLYAGLIGLMWCSCQKEITCEDCNKQNKPPIAIAGADQLIILPANIVTLDGSASSDQDGSIIIYQWKKISGPASFNIIAPSDSITVVNNLVFGVYQFELEVKDNGGLSAMDTIRITVDNSNQSNRPPVADAGMDQIITLPIQTFNLDGSASSDPDNNIAGYTWSKISGPPSFSITDTSAMITQATALQEGLYLFELIVTDSGGLKDTDTVTVNVNPGSNPAEVDIYIAGGNGAPKYWKNGQEILLFPDLPGDDIAISIAVVGNDIYVAGDDNEWPYGDHTWPRYWKNGQEVRLTNGNTYAGTTSIAVAGNDVYVAGWEYYGSNYFAVYWKNGKKVVLTNGIHSESATSIKIAGNDVYVSGYGHNGSRNVAKYWKNGQEVMLTNGIYDAFTTSIAVTGNDVYVSGYDYNGSKFAAKYWKNGQEVMLTNGISDAITTSIAVAGNDIYVTGYEGNINTNNLAARYWKNGQEFSLDNGRMASAVAVYGTDVYITGHYLSTSGLIAKYWKNGQEVMLPNGLHATSIALVKR